MHLESRSIRPELSHLVQLFEGNRRLPSSQIKSKGQENFQMSKVKRLVVWPALSSGHMLHRLLVWVCQMGMWCLWLLVSWRLWMLLLIELTSHYSSTSIGMRGYYACSFFYSHDHCWRTICHGWGKLLPSSPFCLAFWHTDLSYSRIAWYACMRGDSIRMPVVSPISAPSRLTGLSSSSTPWYACAAGDGKGHPDHVSDLRRFLAY